MNSLNIASTGLNQAQKGLGVVSHNVANVNTPGYHKQRLETTELGIPNNGVSEKTTNRYDHFLEQTSAKVNANKSYSEEVMNNRILIESLVGSKFHQENISNITSQFNAYALNPTQNNQNILEATISMAKTGIKDSISVLDNQSNSLKSQLEHEKEILNQKLSAFQGVQDKITKIDSSHALLDERDQLITEISDYSEIQVSKNGSIKTLSTTKGILDTADNFVGGKLGGIQDSIKTISETSSSLSSSLSSFEAKMNEVNNQGLGGGYLFAADGSIIPGSIRLDSVSPGDIGNLASFEDGISQFTNELDSLAVSIGTKVNSERQQFNHRLNLQSSVNEQIQSKVGVNLDEEAIDQIRYERMYQSMAKVIQADEKMFQSLIVVV